MNIMLTASANGLGSFWSTPKILYTETAKKYFGLADKDKLLGLLYLGYPAKDWPQGRRRDIPNTVTWYRG